MSPNATAVPGTFGATKCATILTVAVKVLASKMCPTSHHFAFPKSKVTALMHEQFTFFCFVELVLVFSFDYLLYFKLM